MKGSQVSIFQMVAVLGLNVACFAQPWTGILNPLTPQEKAVKQSAIDWSTAGIPGGVPSGSWTQCGATIQASAFGNGKTDATAAINAALTACGTNHYVLLSAGTFLVNSAKAGSPVIKIAKNYTALRGSGAYQTILVSNGTNSGGIILLGSGVNPGQLYGTKNPVTNSVNILSGATAGSKKVTVDSATNFAVGKEMIVQELNDPSYVTSLQNDNVTYCTFCDGYWNGERTRGQIVAITSVSGNTIEFTPALYTAYTLAPQALPFAPVVYAGVEKLQIYSTNTHTATNNEPILLETCAYCWVKGVEENYNDGDFIKIFWGFHDEVRDSYFSNGFQHGPGQNNGSIALQFKTTASKIENNILERSENPVMVMYGPAGNVIAYNYVTGAYGEPPNISIQIEFHAAHPQFNLVEGNVVAGLLLDAGHGSGSQTTSFRNWYVGSTYVCSPTSGVVRATVDCSSGTWAPNQARGINIDSLVVYNNLIADVVGSSMQLTLPAPHTAVLEWPQHRPYAGAFGLTTGYRSPGDQGTDFMDSLIPYQTTFIHGVYNYIDGSTTWADGITHTLPSSFYLSARPTWWNSSLLFPAIGPDVKTTTGPGGHAGLIPAQFCYLTVMHGKEGGPAGPLVFDSDACYYTKSSSASNLKATSN
jgi:hypothetical protein